jgi:hypothetical protein
MLTKEHARQLLALIEEESKRDSTKNGSVFKEAIEVNSNVVPLKTNKEKLQVLTIANLLDVLESMKAEDPAQGDIDEVSKMIRSLKDFNFYESLSYHISFFRQFVSTSKRTRQGSKKGGLFNLDGSNSIRNTSVHGGNVWSSMRKKRGLGDSSTRKGNVYNSNDVSVKSGGGMRRVNTATGTLSTLSSMG